jgi:glycosyltransferase involved in cell wall biosynthesis
MNIALLAQAESAHTRRWSLALAARGHTVRVFSNSQVGVAPAGMAVEFLPGSSRAAYFRNIFRLRRLLKSFAPDIVHAHFATGYGLWGSCQAVAPLIVSVWGTDIEDALAHRFTVAPIVRRVVKKARLITAPSRFLLERTALFEPSVRQRLRLVPFGVDITDISAKIIRTNADPTVRIIFAKSYLPHYAPDLVLEAFAAALKEYPHLTLTMLGGGPLRQELEARAAALGIAEMVAFHDRVDPEESVRRIAGSDIMVMPSRRESFGVAAVEAAACGVPVIATRIGGIPEVVEDGVSGILIPPDDCRGLAQAILRLAKDGNLRAAMGQAGRAIAKDRFDLNRNLDQLETLYREVLCAS